MKTTRSSAGKAKKAEATKAKPARKSKSPSKKDAKAKVSSGGSVVSIEACKQVCSLSLFIDVYFGIFVSTLILTPTSHLHEYFIP